MRLRLFTLLVVPAAALILAATMLVVERTAEHRKAQDASAVAALVDDVAALDQALGDEALTATLLAQVDVSEDPRDRLASFVLATEDTDLRLGQVERRLASFEYHDSVVQAVAVVRETLRFRPDINSGFVSPLQILDRYSYARDLLLDGLSTQALVMGTDQGQQRIEVIIALIEARSAHLDERVAVDLALRYDRWAPGHHAAVIASVAVQQERVGFANNYLALEQIHIEESELLTAWRDEISLTMDVPDVNGVTWGLVSSAWIARLNGAILDQRASTTRFFTEAEASAASLRRWTLFGVGGALGLALIITAFAAIRLVRRVGIITKQARRMAAGEPTATTFPEVRGGDELGQLAAAFDEMMSHVEDRSRNQAIESGALEAIAQGFTVEEIVGQVALLLGVDENGRARYRFRLDNDSSGAGDRDRGDAAPPTVLVSPIGSSELLPVPDTPEGRTALGLIATARQRDADHARLAWQASRDELTGLYNRGAILGQALELSTEDGSRLPGLMYIDLDMFKSINDQHGHNTGDQVLLIQAERMQRVLQGVGGQVGRLGGDEFLAVVPGLGSDAALEAIAVCLVDELCKPIELDAGTFEIGASVGCVTARPGVPPIKLLNDADAALYEAKRRGRGLALMSTQQLRDQALEDEELRRDVQRAVDEAEFEPWYQPIFADGGASLVGVEALARWPHPERGLVPPGVFLPVAEELGLLPRLDELLFQAVCHQVGRWIRSGLTIQLVHCNLSTAFLESPDFVQAVDTALTASDCPPEVMVAEVTESGLMTDISSNSHRLQTLREHGLRIAVDDFGQGYSSLAYLSDLPVDLLKIDRRFVDRIDEVPANQAIVSAVVNLGRSLELGIVAEGVERAEELDRLVELGCDYYQGYLLGRPAPEKETRALFGRARRPTPSATDVSEVSDLTAWDLPPIRPEER